MQAKEVIPTHKVSAIQNLNDLVRFLNLKMRDPRFQFRKFFPQLLVRDVLSGPKLIASGINDAGEENADRSVTVLTVI